MSLSIFERSALKKLSRTEWVSAYESKIGMDTLYSLTNKGYLDRKNNLGYMGSPLTGIQFRKKKIRRR